MYYHIFFFFKVTLDIKKGNLPCLHITFCWELTKTDFIFALSKTTEHLQNIRLFLFRFSIVLGRFILPELYSGLIGTGEACFLVPLLFFLWSYHNDLYLRENKTTDSSHMNLWACHCAHLQSYFSNHS